MSGLVDTPSSLRTASTRAQRPIGLTSKRVIDIVLAVSALMLLSPLLIVCYVATAVTSPGPALFRHRRVGFRGNHFDCLKFRTTVTDAPEPPRQVIEGDPAAADWAANRKPRVTAIGAVFRSSSLDELPQLFNVLKGEMSIVGPRPVTDQELVRYSDAIDAYLACRPGIIGLWQVSGRSTPTYQKRIACDTMYARKWSMTLDVKILMVTIFRRFAFR
jgi:exopolysaccharide production protein ExoY